MKVDFLSEAAEEFLAAISRYNDERKGLGDEFAAEVRRAVERIEQFPNAWVALSRRTRRCLVNRFPYGVLYQVRGEALLIVAVMHLHRDPKSWRRRLPSGERG